jgi:predicted nucleotidyltransferase
MHSLAHDLLGRIRSGILSALLLHPERSLHVRELARLTHSSPGSLHRELRALAALGLLTRQVVGRNVHYRCNDQNPVIPDLANLLRKTAGVADVLRAALQPLGSRVRYAFIYGSIAAGTERPGSDVDVMVLGDAGFANLVHATTDVSSVLGREINPTPMTVEEFRAKLRETDGFAGRVATGSRIWLVGDEDEFGKLVADQAAHSARAHGRRSAPIIKRDRTKSRGRRRRSDQ